MQQQMKECDAEASTFQLIPPPTFEHYCLC